MFYYFEEAAAARFQAFHDAFDEVARCGRVGHIAAEGKVKDRKRNAGAGALVNRHVVRPHKNPPRRITTNIEVPALPVGRQTLHFFPDRVLVVDPGAAGAVAYADLRLEIRQARFIENEGVPSDAQVVGNTWQDKSTRVVVLTAGSKITESCRWHFMKRFPSTSASGLNEVVQLTRHWNRREASSGHRQVVGNRRMNGLTVPRLTECSSCLRLPDPWTTSA